MMPALPQPPTSSLFDLPSGPNPVWTRWLLQLFKRSGGSVGETVPEVSAALAVTQSDVASLQTSLSQIDARVSGLETPDVSTVENLPSASVPGKMIFVSNESGGAVMAFSDGTDWRRVTDRAVVS